MLRHLLAFSGVVLVLGACSSRSSLGSGDDDLNQGGSSGTGGSSSGGGPAGGGSGGSGGSWDPCSGKPCGAECTLCDPKDPTCIETAVLKFCDATGTCSQAYPECGPPPQCTADTDCPDIGAPCQQCPDGSFACPWTKCEAGQCVSGFDSCQGQACKDDGDCPEILLTCQKCPDGSFACPWTKCEAGQCVGGFEGCNGHDPCAGKACGDPCTVCPPGDPTCNETAVLKFCNASGQCAPSYPICMPTPGQCKVDSDCPAVEVCKPCPSGKCAEVACINGACGWQCPPPTTPECKVASDCVMTTICMGCPDGSCAKPDCLNGKCELVCGL